MEKKRKLAKLAHLLCNKMTRISLLIFIFFCGNCLQAQKQTGIDSLQNALKNYDAQRAALNKTQYDMADSNKVNILIGLGRLLYNTKKHDKAQQYAEEALRIAEKIGFEKGRGDAYSNMGNIYNFQGNYTEALKNYKASLLIREKIGDRKGVATLYHNMGIIYDYQSNYTEALKNYRAALSIREQMGDKRGIALSYNVMGVFYDNRGNYVEALKYYLAAVKISEEIDNKKGMAAAYSNVGNIYSSQGNYPEALKNYLIALKIREKIGDKQSLANSYDNIGDIYSTQGNYPEALKNHLAALKIYEEIGYKRGIAVSSYYIATIYLKQGNAQDALKMYGAILKIYEEMEDKQGIAANYSNMGDVYKFQGNSLEALKQYMAALKMQEEIGDKHGIITSYINLGELNTQLKNYTAAKRYLDDGLFMAKEMGWKEAIKDSYEVLTTLDSATETWREAYLHHQLYIIYRDSLLNEENTKKLTQTQMQYVFDKKQDSLTLENTKKELSLRKEMELKALKYEYEKKQAAAKTEKEKEELKFEQLLKAKEIENAYAQKIAKAEELQRQKDADRKQREAILRLNQEKKDALNKEEIKRQQNIRNFILLGLLGTLLFALVVFRQRNKVRKEKKRSDALLLNILPEEIATELKETGAIAAKQYNEVTVLFTDFVNFTGISEKLSPTELVAEIHKNFTAFDAIIEKHGLEKIKTIGDAYMAVCGLPQAHKDHAQRVVRASIEIRDFIAQSKGKFQIRIGINSGAVVAGIVGVKKYAYDIWGDTVNTASRIEANSEAGKINISGSTYEIVKEEFSCTYRGKIHAKGKGEVDMYFVEPKK